MVTVPLFSKQAGPVTCKVPIPTGGTNNTVAINKITYISNI